MRVQVTTGKVQGCGDDTSVEFSPIGDTPDKGLAYPLHSVHREVITLTSEQVDILEKFGDNIYRTLTFYVNLYPFIGVDAVIQKLKGKL